MIRSSALSSSTFCHGDDATLTITTQPMIRAIVQKEIIKRHIRGEQIPSIKDELISLLDAKGAKFENYIQKQQAINEWTIRIERYLAYFDREFANTNLIFPEDLSESSDKVDIELANNTTLEVMPTFDFA